jgi:hypothetical protein
MKRLSVLVVVAAIAAAAVFVTTGGAKRADEQTLTLIEGEAADYFVDNPPKSKGQTFRVSPGDLGVVRVPLYDEAGVRQGTAHVSCVGTRGGTIDKAVFLCTGTFKLNDGTIGLSTVFVGQSDERIAAVTGGTGAYEGARGSITSEFGPDGNRIHTVHLLP